MAGSTKNLANLEYSLTPRQPRTGRAQLPQAAVNRIFYEVQWDPQLNALVEHLTPEQITNQPTWQI